MSMFDNGFCSFDDVSSVPLIFMDNICLYIIEIFKNWIWTLCSLILFYFILSHFGVRSNHMYILYLCGAVSVHFDALFSAN